MICSVVTQEAGPRDPATKLTINVRLRTQGRQKGRLPSLIIVWICLIPLLSHILQPFFCVLYGDVDSEEIERISNGTLQKL